MCHCWLDGGVEAHTFNLSHCKGFITCATCMNKPHNLSWAHAWSSFAWWRTLWACFAWIYKQVSGFVRVCRQLCHLLDALLIHQVMQGGCLTSLFVITKP